jgi:hypothetical protein
MFRPAQCFLVVSLLCTVAVAHDHFTIQVVDDVTGRGVPLVELRTVNHLRLYTDSSGIVAFDEPGLMDQEVFFHVSSHGYEYPQDRFGYQGKRLKIRPGGKAKLKIKRVNIAQRLYRMTGAGIYRDSVLVGEPVPIEQPLLNAQVLGSDSVVNEIYNGKIYWFWGDTNRSSYPLGNFHVPGAVSQLPGMGGLDPDVGVNLDYFVDEMGFAKPTAEMPGSGPTWINGLVTLKESDGREHLFTTYAKVKPPLSIYERGLARFNDDTSQFDKWVSFDMDAPAFPRGHPLTHQDNGIKYVYFADPFPVVRVPATSISLRDLAQYEVYTCLKKGCREDSIAVDKKNGHAVFRWKTDTIPFTPKLQAKLIRQGLIRPEEGLFQLFDQNGKPVVMHGGSTYWNDYRKRWIMIGVEFFGTSLLGEVWYAESENLVGPWKNARKIATHQKYSFYNPKQHPMLDKEDGRVVFFEGTYTIT